MVTMPTYLSSPPTHSPIQSNQAFAYISVILILFACFPSLLLPVCFSYSMFSFSIHPCCLSLWFIRLVLSVCLFKCLNVCLSIYLLHCAPSITLFLCVSIIYTLLYVCIFATYSIYSCFFHIPPVPCSLSVYCNFNQVIYASTRILLKIKSSQLN